MKIINKILGTVISVLVAVMVLPVAGRLSHDFC